MIKKEVVKTGWLTRLAVILAIPLLAAVGAGCGGDDDSSDNGGGGSATAAGESSSVDSATTGELPAAPSLEGKRIAYIQTSPVDYFEKSRDGAEEAVKALGGEFVSFNSNYEPQTEFKNVQDAVTQGVDGILLFSISKGTLESSARVAKQADIPVVDYYGYGPGVDEDLVDGWVGADAYKVGQLAGQGMVEALGDCQGCEVAQVQGVLGRGDVEGYHDGFLEVIEKAGLKQVDAPTSNWSRQEALARAQELVQKYPNLKGMFCHNDDTTIGCVQALKQAGKGPGDITMVTENGSPDGIRLVEQGWLAANVGWSPAEESALAVHMLALVLDGQEVEFPLPCHAPLTTLTEENLDQAAPWDVTPELAEEWVKNSSCEITDEG